MFGTELPTLLTSIPGPRSSALADELARAECPALTARRARRAEHTGASHDPISWQQAAGANVRDVDGNVFVDLTGGFGAALFAHRHPPIVEAVSQQLGQLVHALGDLQPSERKVALLSALSRSAPFAARTILGLSGADAIEAALKTALLATKRPGVVAFEGGYHGLSHGPLAACGYGEGFRKPFAEQLNPHVRFAPYATDEAEVARALHALELAIEALEGRAGALLLEPLQGRGGVRMPAPGFLRKAAELAHARGLLVIVDEIYTGLGRSGHMFLYLAEHVEADLVCLGKGLGGGFPISACIGREEVMAAWGDPAGEALHTSTFLGNPIACAAALATLQELELRDVPALARERERKLRAALHTLPGVRVRGRGLLLGVELGAPERVLFVMRALLERGYIIAPAGAPPSVLCLTPPLCLTDRQIDGFVRALSACLSEAP
ncbi:MAG: Gamma-aminobutyrate alpha-ketoglutarate aminotransferase [Myxococcaceae bacterium]|nr:Gamma-aminobutyrate alpha-ketoglutarate aminotransferase [Myxococcaceae bacterium]